MSSTKVVFLRPEEMQRILSEHMNRLHHTFSREHYVLTLVVRCINDPEGILVYSGETDLLAVADALRQMAEKAKAGSDDVAVLTMNDTLGKIN